MTMSKMMIITQTNDKKYDDTEDDQDDSHIMVKSMETARNMVILVQKMMTITKKTMILTETITK